MSDRVFFWIFFYIDFQTLSAQVTPRIQASVSAGVRGEDEDVLEVPRPQAAGGGGGGGGLDLSRAEQ